MSDGDPRDVRVLVVTVEDVVSALAANERRDAGAVLRVTPPYRARMRARLHREGAEGGYDDPRLRTYHPSAPREAMARTPESILSHGEREVARLATEGHSVPQIAAARNASESEVEKSLARVREKTERALVTLLESPYVAEVATDLEADEREAIRTALHTSGT